MSQKHQQDTPRSSNPQKKDDFGDLVEEQEFFQKNLLKGFSKAKKKVNINLKLIACIVFIFVMYF